MKKTTNTATAVIRIPTLTSTIRTFFNRILFLLTIVGPDLVLATVMTAILIASVLFVGGKVEFFQATLGFPVLIMCALLTHRIIARYAQNNKKLDAWIILRDWLPFLLVAFVYENLHGLCDHFYVYDFAEVFYKWDLVLFRVEPTLWIQQFHTPLLTDIMSICYALYFILALIIMFFLSHQNRRFEFREITLALTFTFMFGFICYVIWPTSPPRYFITELFTDPVRLHGVFIFELFQGAWDNFEATGYGAFPSLHVGISSIALLYAWKFRKISKLYKWIWWLYIPLVTSLWISTVYLRHHWVIDIFAGWILAIIGFFLSENILKLWKNLRARYGLS